MIRYSWFTKVNLYSGRLPQFVVTRLFCEGILIYFIVERPNLLINKENIGGPPCRRVVIDMGLNCNNNSLFNSTTNPGQPKDVKWSLSTVQQIFFVTGSPTCRKNNYSLLSLQQKDKNVNPAILSVTWLTLELPWTCDSDYKKASVLNFWYSWYKKTLTFLGFYVYFTFSFNY